MKGKSKTIPYQEEMDKTMDRKKQESKNKGKKGKKSEYYGKDGKLNIPWANEEQDQQSAKSQPRRNEGRWEDSTRIRDEKQKQLQEKKGKYKDPESKGTTMVRNFYGKMNRKQGKGAPERQQQQQSVSDLWEEEDKSPNARTGKNYIKDGQDRQNIGQETMESELNWQSPRKNAERQGRQAKSYHDYPKKGTSRLGDWNEQGPGGKGEGGNVKGMDGKKRAEYDAHMEPYGKHLSKGKSKERGEMEQNYQQRQIFMLQGTIKRLKKHIQTMEQQYEKQPRSGKPQSRYSDSAAERQGKEGSSMDSWKTTNQADKKPKNAEVCIKRYRKTEESTSRTEDKPDKGKTGDDEQKDMRSQEPSPYSGPKEKQDGEWTKNQKQCQSEGNEKKNPKDAEQQLKELEKSSQQSGISGDSWPQRGTQEGVQTIPLHLRKAAPYFSEEEKEYFAAAAMEGKVSQAHYTNPDADVCYRCPLCAKVLNPIGLAKHTATHFLRMHNTPNKEYLVTLHEDPQRQIRIKTGGVMSQRSGADPPPLSLIQEYEDAEWQGKKDGATEGGNRITMKYKLQPMKRRPGQLMGSAKKSAKGRGKTMKRKPMWSMRQQEESGKLSGKSKNDPDTPGIRKEIPSDAEEKGEEEDKKEKDHRQLEVSKSMNPQNMKMQPDERTQPQAGETDETKPKEAEKMTKEKDDVQMEGSEQEATGINTQSSGQKGEMLKKRQRTILEYMEQRQDEGKETMHPTGKHHKGPEKRLQPEHPGEEGYYQQDDMQSVEEAAEVQEEHTSSQMAVESMQHQRQQ